MSIIVFIDLLQTSSSSSVSTSNDHHHHHHLSTHRHRILAKLQDDRLIPPCSADGQLPILLTANLCRGILIYRSQEDEVSGDHNHNNNLQPTIIATYMTSTGTKHWYGKQSMEGLLNVLQPYKNITII